MKLCLARRSGAWRTFNPAAQELGPEADGAVDVPGLGVDPEEAGRCGDRQNAQNRRERVPVPCKYLER